MMLTQKRLKELLQYDELLGVFTWRVSKKRIQAGKRAGGIRKKDGYRQFQVDGVKYLVHRLAWLYMEGYFPEHEIDHINRVRDDNRWCNLRHVTKLCNMQNICTNKSGTPGVSRHTKTGKWQVHHGGKYIGYYTKLQEAIEAKKTAISGAICFSS